MRHKTRAKVRSLLKTLNPKDYEKLDKIRINDLGLDFHVVAG